MSKLLPSSPTEITILLLIIALFSGVVWFSFTASASSAEVGAACKAKGGELVQGFPKSNMVCIKASAIY